MLAAKYSICGELISVLSAERRWRRGGSLQQILCVSALSVRTPCSNRCGEWNCVRLGLRSILFILPLLLFVEFSGGTPSRTVQGNMHGLDRMQHFHSLAKWLNLGEERKRTRCSNHYIICSHTHTLYAARRAPCAIAGMLDCTDCAFFDRACAQKHLIANCRRIQRGFR